jgi:predicted ArsR family transcriptional regulator
MPPQLTQDQREQITAALFRREDAKDIADANGISERQVRRIAQNLKQYGTVTAPRLKKMGRPTCLNKEIEDVSPLSRLELRINCWAVLNMLLLV